MVSDGLLKLPSFAADSVEPLRSITRVRFSVLSVTEGDSPEPQPLQ
jgi:hypothetical protein